MPSPSQNSVDLPLLTLGGRVTQYDAQGLPTGASPFNHDVVYSGVDPFGQGMVTGVMSRPGMQNFYPVPFNGNPSVNYLKTFIDSQTIYHLLSLDSLGVVRDESPCPTVPIFPAVIGSVVAASIAQSDSLLNREWIAISTTAHPGFGIDIPRQWNGQFFDRVSQVGPGEPPTVADYLQGYALQNSPNGVLPTPGQALSAAVESNNTVTFTLASTFLAIFGATLGANAVLVGDSVQYSGDTTAGYNGTFVVTAVIGTNQIQVTNLTTGLPPSGDGTLYFGITTFVTSVTAPSDQFPLFSQATVQGTGSFDTTWEVRGLTQTIGSTSIYGYAPVFAQANGGGGTIFVGGNIGAGTHQVSVGFITREYYFTKPAPYATWTAMGGFKAILTNIPTGPVPNIIGRYLVFTPVITPPALTGPFFYFDGPVPVNMHLTFPSMIINDNTTTTYTVDFTDAVLENATSATNLFNLLELGECANVCAYSGRTFWCGERNKVPNFLNLTFDGGFSGNRPLGWKQDGVHDAGGSPSPQPYYGGGYRITGDGNPANVGLLYQGAAFDYLGVPILNLNVGYSFRVRLRGGGLVSGGFTVDLYDPAVGVISFATIDQSLVTGNYAEFIKLLLIPETAISPNLQLRIYATPNSGGYFDIDCLEIFPTAQPYNNTQIRASYALDPESFDQTTGIMQVGPGNGFAARALFQLLDNKLYIATELGLYSTQDDGQNEPNLWSINTVSATMGTGSCRGVGIGDSWAIIVHRTGAYIFWGSEPVKITQEIQPDWDTINWDADQTIYCVVDTINKRIHIGAPVNGATSPNVEFVCDYAQLANAEGQVSGQDIAAHPQAYYSVYNPTKVVAPGKARKWTLWNISMNCAALTIRSDGSYHLLRGNGTSTGKVYDQVPSQLSDDGMAINSQYQTAYMPQIEDEQVLQLGGQRKLFKWMRNFVTGSGQLSWTIYGAMNQRAMQLYPDTLQYPAQWDQEKNINWVGERASFLLGTNMVGSWFRITRISVTLQREIMTPVRGMN